MDRFLLDQNITLYRRLRNSLTGETERRMIIELLAEQMDTLKNERQQEKLGKSVRHQSKPVRS
jgi:hypothetical protein